MKKRLLIYFISLIFITTGFAQTFSGGDGSEENPYLISSKADMETLADAVNGGNSYVGKYFLQTKDIIGITKVIGDTITWPQNLSFPFSGKYDGNNHVIDISDIKNNNPTVLPMTGIFDFNVGIFGYISNAIIKNINTTGKIKLIPKWTSSRLWTGGICGYASSSFISNCHSKVEFVIDDYFDDSHTIYVGGICGWAINTDISDCHNEGNISVEKFYPVYVGGICGYSTGSITRCSNEGKIILTYNDRIYGGGICGNSSGKISQCHNKGELISNDNRNIYGGGICGNSSDIISDCYNSGRISSLFESSPYCNLDDYLTAELGGICGSGKDISNCYSTGNLSAILPERDNPNYNINHVYVGGVSPTNTSVKNSFTANIEIVCSGESFRGETVCFGWGSNCYSSSIQINGKSPHYITGEEINFSSFLWQEWIEQKLEWNFDEIWEMSDINSENKGLPILKWQNKIKQHTIAASSDSNGRISPSGNILVDEGDNKMFAFNPNTGYEIDKVLIDGTNNTVAVSAGNYTFTNITANHTIEVSYKLKQYTIAATSGSGGNISPVGNITVNHGEDKTFTFTPNADYEINKVLINGIENPSAKATGAYTFMNITNNHSIEVTFRKIETQLSNITINSGGTLYPTFSSEMAAYKLYLDCNQNMANVTFSCQMEDISFSVDEESFTGEATKILTLDKPGQKAIYIVLQRGSYSQTYTLQLIRPFDNVIVPVWDDVLSVINIPVNNGGYTFTSYQWYKDPLLLQKMEGENKPNLYLPEKDNNNTDYTVWLTSSDGISSCGCRYQETVPQLQSVKVFPNPFVTEIKVKNNTWKQTDIIELRDLYGTLIKKQNVDSEVTTMQVEGLAPGIYLLYTEGNVFKIIKK